MSGQRPSPEEASLARSLADPDKKVRDEATRGLGEVVAGRGGGQGGTTGLDSELDMLKFWKGLYYCLWLSDKPPIQMELATTLSRLVHSCPTEERALQFLTGCFRTVLREWALLDQYRVNKFYSLLRFVVREAFVYLHTRRWPAKTTLEVLKIFQSEILSKLPNGPRLHIADVFLPELLVVTKGDILTGDLLVLLSPFLDLLSVGVGQVDMAFKERVREKVFESFAQEFAAENEQQLQQKDQQQSKESVFHKCRTGAIQAAVFSAASSESTLDGNRKLLYSIHKSFEVTTGVAFAEEEEGDKARAETQQPDGGATGGGATKANTKAKAKATATATATATTTATTNAKPAAPAAAKASKQPKSSSTSPPEPPAAAAPAVAPAAGRGDKKRKSEVEARSEDEEGKGKNKKAAAAAAATEVDSSFIASPKFAGRKPGYCFKKGADGIGYYVDAVQQKAAKKKAEPAPAAQKKTLAAEEKGGKKGAAKKSR